nr:hypothetical protein [Streptomyces sp. MK5]
MTFIRSAEQLALPSVFTRRSCAAGSGSTSPFACPTTGWDSGGSGVGTRPAWTT